MSAPVTGCASTWAGRDSTITLITDKGTQADVRGLLGTRIDQMKTMWANL